MYRLRGTFLPDETTRELYVDAAGRVAGEPLRGADLLHDGGWVVPGLVDAHCHVGLRIADVLTLDEAAEQAAEDRDAGALLLRDCGSPLDTSPLRDRADLPEIIRCGRHLSTSRRYIRGVAHEVEDQADLAAAVTAQVAASDGWVKLVGDWIDRDAGDLSPVWSDDALTAGIAAAHAAGARVTAHVFGEGALPGLIRAGIDCLEHGTGLTPDLLGEMAARGTALVPTLVNIENFPSIADGASKFPAYADHMRALHGGVRAMVRTAVEAGVPVYAGTDAGGAIAHGTIADEVLALHEAGLPAADALAAASWAARDWLGRPGLVPGAPADLVVYDRDPRTDLTVLHEPRLILLNGRPVPTR